MKLIYVAGPYTAEDAYGVELNTQVAEIRARAVIKAGGMPVVPHAMTRNINQEADNDFWLAGTMALMERCDAVMLCHGWQESKGTLAEIARAKELGLIVFDSNEVLADWIGRHERLDKICEEMDDDV